MCFIVHTHSLSDCHFFSLATMLSVMQNKSENLLSSLCSFQRENDLPSSALNSCETSILEYKSVPLPTYFSFHQLHQFHQSSSVTIFFTLIYIENKHLNCLLCFNYKIFEVFLDSYSYLYSLDNITEKSY